MKTLVKNYTFNKSLKQVTISNIAELDIEQVLLITNVTANVIIYNFADPLAGGYTTGNVLVLDFDTASMSDTDKLQIFLDIPNYQDLETLADVLVAGMSGILTQLQSMKKSQGMADVGGRVRTVAEGGSVAISSGTVTTVSNIASVGGFAGNLYVATQTNQGWASLRNKIGVS
jgi:hypothetical protein